MKVSPPATVTNCIGTVEKAAIFFTAYFTGHAVQGFTTVILLLLIIGSVIMTSLGIMGYYLAKIYEEVKRRPVYIISEVKES